MKLNLNFFRKKGIDSEEAQRLLHHEISELNKEVSEFEHETLTIKDDLSIAEKKLETLVKETDEQLKEYLAKIRDQTEADILLNALKAVGIIRDPDKNTNHQDQHQSLMSDLNTLGKAQARSGNTFEGCTEYSLSSQAQASALSHTLGSNRI